MCGIVGVFSSFLTKREEDIFRFLWNLDVVRGEDSSGVISVKRQGVTDNYSVDYMKRVGLPTYVVQSKEYKDKIIGQPGIWRKVALIGHNRAATRGEVTARNAHPFRHNHITMVHNGTLKWGWDPTCSGRGKEFEVDSDALAWGVAKHGIDKVYKELEGAATCVWWDNRENQMKFISNGERPFHWMLSPNGHDMIFASEKWMLEAVIARFKFTPDEKGIRNPAKHNLFRHRLDPQNKIVQWGGELENKPKPRVVTHYNGASNYPGAHNQGNQGSNYSYVSNMAGNRAPAGSGGCNTRHVTHINQPNKEVNKNSNFHSNTGGSEPIKLIDFRERKEGKEPKKESVVGLGTIPLYGLFPISECYTEKGFENKFSKNCANCDADLDYHSDFLLDGEDHVGICHYCYSSIEEIEGTM